MFEKVSFEVTIENKTMQARLGVVVEVDVEDFPGLVLPKKDTMQKAGYRALDLTEIGDMVVAGLAPYNKTFRNSEIAQAHVANECLGDRGMICLQNISQDMGYANQQDAGQAPLAIEVLEIRVLDFVENEEQGFSIERISFRDKPRSVEGAKTVSTSTRNKWRTWPTP